MHYRHVFFVLFSLSCWLMIAQAPVQVHLTDETGLPDTEIYSLVEDADGFIWIAANKGLYRYDGSNYLAVSHPDKNGLSVFDLNIDSQNRLWCTNISGQLFYIERGSTQMVMLTEFEELKNNQLGDIFVVDDTLYVFYRKKAFSINITTKKISLIHQGVSKLTNPILTDVGIICFDENFQYHFQFNGSKRVSPIASVLNQIKTDFDFVLLTELNNYLLLNSNKGNNKGIALNYSGTISKTLPLELKKNKISSITRNNDLFFAGTNNGVVVFKFINGHFTVIDHFLKEEYVTSIILDANNNHWFSTLNNGIYVIPNFNIKHYLKEKHITCFALAGKERLLYGTYRGEIGLYDLTKRETAILRKENGLKVTKITPLDKDYSSLLISCENEAMLFTNNYLKPLKTRRLVGLKDVAIINDKEFIATDYGSVKLFYNDEAEPIFRELIRPKRSYDTFFDKKEARVFIASADNLIVYDVGLQNHKKLNLNQKSIFATAIDQTTEGTVWFSTFDHGILAYKGDSLYRAFKNSPSLPQEIHNLKADDNHLWLTSSSGIYHLDTKKGKTTRFSRSKGVPDYDINQIEIWNKQVIFAGNSGFFTISKDIFESTPPPPQLYIRDIAINNTDKVEIQTKYELNYDQNNISIDFFNNGFESSKNTQYSYRLISKNGGDWKALPSGSNRIDLYGLSPDQYTLTIKATKYDNEQLVDYKTITFLINKPIWQQWWFVLLIVAVSVAIVTTIFLRTLRRQKNEQQRKLQSVKQKEKLTALKLENLRSQMNPHFIFNALNSIQEYIVLNETNLASNYLGKFADLIRIYLNNSSKGNISLHMEIDCLNKYLELEKMRFEDKLSYSISIDNELRDEHITIPTMLVQPYVENAIKHGLMHLKSDRKLAISFKKQPEKNTLICIIKDNGVGRERAEKIKALRNYQHRSFASKATENRLVLLNEHSDYDVGVTISDIYKKNKAAGTKVVIIIPYN